MAQYAKSLGNAPACAYARSATHFLFCVLSEMTKPLGRAAPELAFAAAQGGVVVQT
jgi:hypothetical protein